jgi:hypothetical protein
VGLHHFAHTAVLSCYAMSVMLLMLNWHLFLCCEGDDALQYAPAIIKLIQIVQLHMSAFSGSRLCQFQQLC